MTNWHASYFHPKPAEYPSALLPHQEAMIEENNRYVLAGAGANLNPLCMSLHGGRPCVYSARSGRNSCGRRHSVA